MNQPQFDVFLAHNSLDKPQVRVVAAALKLRGLEVWIDEEQISPGQIFQVEIQKAIQKVKTAVIFIGKQGLGRWQTIELPTLYSQFMQAENVTTVIPVLLPDVKEIPKDLLFLTQHHWVSFANGIDDVEALYQLEWGITGRKPERKTQPISQPIQPVIPSDDLSSEKGVDYRRLRDLLAAGKWKEADEETLVVMLKASGREKEGWLNVESINNFPCTDLRTIDQLWVKHSNGRFGFSVQKRIWESVGGTPDADYEIYRKFGEAVGWRVNEEWINYPREVIFNTSAAKGHLPLKNCFGNDFWDVLRDNLFSRVETCEV
ncbi:GUN4 domain-containing protein [Calothrix sp. PCC 7507]|uniref:GUN4 domain-containing protein n=1 Tax=Calothrix sp. PCC 7507 TaxID=99598 RepID=UPI00029EE6AB|nr:GUN4 domain-containing protein [Calothrix sp. PCC 7507]AFY33551.1 GUN4 domain protein [Calothrix sp. PCC 7507]